MKIKKTAETYISMNQVMNITSGRSFIKEYDKISNELHGPMIHKPVPVWCDLYKHRMERNDEIAERFNRSNTAGIRI